MERTLDLCRWTYNQTLAYRKEAWEKESRSTSKYETNNLLPGWKTEKPELNDVFSQVLQNAQERVDLALKASISANLLFWSASIWSETWNFDIYSTGGGGGGAAVNNISRAVADLKPQEFKLMSRDYLYVAGDGRAMDNKVMGRDGVEVFPSARKMRAHSSMHGSNRASMGSSFASRGSVNRPSNEPIFRPGSSILRKSSRTTFSPFAR